MFKIITYSTKYLSLVLIIFFKSVANNVVFLMADQYVLYTRT